MLSIAFGSHSQIGGVTAPPILPAALPTAGRFQIELVVMSPADAQHMLPFANDIVQKALRSGAFMRADSDLRIVLPQARFKLDRERIADLGMTVEDVSRQLGLFLSGNFVNRFDLNGRAYRVIPMIEEGGRPNPNALMNLKVRTPRGDLMPLSALATLEETVAPRLLGNFQQNNAFRIIGGLLPGTTPDQGLTTLENIAAEVLPPEYSVDYAGESRQQRQEGNTLVGVLGFSLAFVFMAFAIQFSSIRDPLVVMRFWLSSLRANCKSRAQANSLRSVNQRPLNWHHPCCGHAHRHSLYADDLTQRLSQTCDNTLKRPLE